MSTDFAPEQPQDEELLKDGDLETPAGDDGEDAGDD
jgi:hypothetical protein